MISSSSLTDFGWSSASFLNGVASAEAAPLSNDQSAAADSFQNVFAQVTAPGVPAGNTTAQAADFSWANASQSSLDSSPITRPAADSRTSQNPDRANSRTTERNATQRIAKPEVSRRTAQSSSGSTNGVISNGGTLTQTADALSAPSVNAVSDAPSSAKASRTALSQGGLPLAAATVLGGLKSLSGTAFAMHITTSGAPASTSQGNTGQGGSNQNNQSQTNQDQGNAGVASGTLTTGDAAISTSSAAAASATQVQLLSENSNAAAASGLVLTGSTSPLPAATLPGQTEASSAPLISTSIESGEIGDETPSGAPQTVRTVQVQLAGEGESRVDLRLVEHAGGLSVSVRASDSALTKGLQDNLPELSARLAAEKYQTHTFLSPANEASGGGSSSGSSDQSSGQGQEQPGRSFSQGGQSGQSGGQAGNQSSGQQGEQQGQDQGAAWWRQLAALSKLSSSVSNSVQGSQSVTAADSAANS